MEQLIGTVLGASIALLGVIANAHWMRAAARDERRAAEAMSTEAAEQQFLAAKRLVLTDLQRAADRLEATVDTPETNAHWLELPRGAWREHRTLLANRLERDSWWALADAFNYITDWNDLVCSAGTLSDDRRALIRERHAIVWGLVMRAIALVGPGVADDLALQRELAFPGGTD